MRRARLMVDDPTAMAPSSASDDGRLVQKIFFPSFVDAGGNESFDGVKQHHQQQNTNTISKGGFVVADQQQQRRRMRMPNDDIVGDDGALDRSSSCGLNESVASEASTAVRDNRSSNHPILVFGQKANKNNHNKPFPPSFFASTKPLVLSTAAAAAATTAMPIPPSPAAAVPMSPPKLTRRATATTTTNNNTTYAAAPVPAVLTRRFPFVDTDDDDNQNNSGESVFQDATGIAIVPASFATATSKSRLEEDLDQNVGEVYPWRNDDIHKEGVMESDSTSTSTTATSSRLPPKSLFDEDDTVVTANGPLFIDNGAVVVDPVAWEEEATPDQTAFGKMLLFRRVLRTNSENKDDDVSSTASENGSLVNDGVDGAIPAAYAAVVDESNNRKVTTVTGITANTSSDDEEESSEYTTPQQHEYSEPIWDEATLALPVFLESNTTTNSNSNQNIGSIISGIPDDGHYRIGSSKTILTSNETSKTAIRNNGDCSPPSKQEEEDCAESSAKPSVIGTTGLLSMAIRRLGSGLTSTTGSSNINNNMRSKCVSAPTTPLASSYGGFSHFTGNDNGMMQSSPLGRQVTLSARDEEDAITPRPSFPNPTSFAFSPKQQQQPSSHLPSSFLLRSPGSLAFQAASTKSLNNGGKGPIPPRFAYWHGGGNQQNHRRQVFSKIPEDDVAARDENSKSTRLINSNPFYIARSCFSFDAYDTSVNDQHELYADNQTSQLYSREQPSQSTLSARQSEVLNVDARGNASLPVPSTGQFIQESTSWDFGGATQPQRQHHSSAFRPRSGHTRGGNAQPLRVSKSFNVSPSRKSTRERLTSNYSPTLESRGINDTETQELKSPQRLEIEREDALDILSCLVERGVSWKESHPTKKDLDSTSIRIENCKASDDQNVKPTVNTVNDNMTAYADIESIVRELQELSLAEEKLGDFHNNSKSHQTRILALEELLRSHQYALEMKRASHSASSWLHSIGRSQSSSPSKSLSPARNVILSEETTTLDSPSQVNTSDSETTRHSQQVAGEESSASDSIDLLTAKAMLHTIQMEAKEKSDLADKLNEELAKCRAEIGRLKSSSQATSFRSPNRSILDESDEISVTEGDEDVNVDEEMYTLDRVIEESDCLDSSFLREGDGEDRLETAQLRRALDEANEIIRAMHCDLKNGNEWGDKAPIILVPGIGEMSKYNVQAPYILDGDKENCIGHWCDVSDSLIGPPDHGVRSPIVEAVLEAWTSDSTLHESLLTWLSDILSGDNIDSISPLTLHSLDCEVRDGFLLHVLPLLFLRPNLRLNVKTRIQRHSTYDVSVSVDHCNDDVQNPLSRVRSQLETTPAISGVGSAARHISSSNAMKDNADRSSLRVKTEIQDDVDGSTPIARGGASSRLSYDEMSEDITSSEDVPPGIMSALGGALGGFLNRRKGGVLASHETMPPHGPQGGMQTILESPASVGLAHEIVGLVAETDDDEQPYHRVVSAPPGRIGVTFVEYRGHCMLSDVYPDSPLIGWVFPSDVLIAIDDLPVSGMRVRDIIKVLKDRTSAQRALRVISSHAMNEFTMNASIVTDETG